MVKWHSLVAALALCACASVTPSAPPRLELTWRVGGLANPESVALSQDGAFLYVSNVNGEGQAKDGNGFIARVSTDGRILQRDFATGLDGPKGLVLRGDTLYAADIDQIVAIDAATGAIRQRFAAAGARFLNDIAIAPNGDVLASDSETKRIYMIRVGEASTGLSMTC
jgi:DNA-binding beta-propeller fold protein YncE